MDGCIGAAVETCGGGISGQLLGQLIGTLLASQCALNPNYPIDKSMNYEPSYDFIVVGAGSAGSALAAKLSENPNWNILVVEAGTDPPQFTDVPGLLFSSYSSEIDWNYKTEPQQNSCRAKRKKRCKWPRGKVLGGSSTINAMIFQAGNKHDYNSWEKYTNDTTWSWHQIQHYFSEILQLTGSFVDRSFAGNSQMQDLILNAAREMNWNVLDNEWDIMTGMIGYFHMFATLKNGARMNVAKAYLSPAVSRKNLHIMKHSHVGRILINETTKAAYGVEIWSHNKWIQIKASKEVIISAGTINSAQLLMLSGIGPKDHLQSLNIDVIADLPVGENLQDHVFVDVNFALTKLQSYVVQEKDFMDFLYQYFMHRSGPLAALGVTSVVGFINTNKTESIKPNLQIHHFLFTINDTLIVPGYLKLLNGDDWYTKSLQSYNSKYSIFAQLPTLLKPKSRGYIQLKSKDPFEAPIIDPRTNTDPHDMQTLIDGVKYALEMSKTESLQALGAEFIKLDLKECEQLVFESDPYWECYVRSLSNTLYHPVGTNSMGTNPLTSVVNSDLQVHGITNLRVADASIMPEIVSGNTNVPAIMIGLKAASILYNQHTTKKHDEL